MKTPDILVALKPVVEEIMENYALYRLMEETEDDELFDLESAKKYYSIL